MTSKPGKAFRIIGHWWGESYGYQWFAPTRESDKELWWVFVLVAKQAIEKKTVIVQVIWDAIVWRQCNDFVTTENITWQRWLETVAYFPPWWRHQMETFSALLAICAGNSPVPGEFPTQRPVTRSFDVYFDLRPNKRLSKQWWGWWFETQSCPLWCHRNAMRFFIGASYKLEVKTTVQILSHKQLMKINIRNPARFLAISSAILKDVI